MLTRRSGYLAIAEGTSSAATAQLQEQGWALLEQVFTDDEVRALGAEISQVFETLDADVRSTRRDHSHYEQFRYEMLNHSALAREAIGHPVILATIEPLLGEDCHVIANTAWRQAPEESRHGGRFWHIDAGPHVPRPAGVDWDDRIPYPVFAIGAHIFLMDCPLECGPTGVIPGSHKSGQAPPKDRLADESLTWNGIGMLPLTARAGDVALFVSDVWHRRLPSSEGDPGRFFLQCHYGRRDLAQRLRTPDRVNHLSLEAIERASTLRARTLIGLHEPGFYDA